MRRSVEIWIQECKVCQGTKPTLKKEIAPLGRYIAVEPMERIANDVMGLLPETAFLYKMVGSINNQRS